MSNDLPTGLAETLSRNVGMLRIFAPPKPTITSPCLRPALSAGLPVTTSPTRMPLVPASSPSCLARTGVSGSELDADPGPVHLAVLDELVGHLGGHVDRDGEADAVVAAAAGDDRRIDADDLAAHVDAADRPSCPGLIGASVCRNDSYSLIPTLFRSVAEMMPVVTLWLSSNGDPTAMTSSPTFSLLLSPRGKRRIACVVDLDHGHVGLGVGADHLRGRLGAVVERHGDLLGPVDDVVVGQDVAAVVVDKA